MLKKVTLVFKTIFILWAFAQAINTNDFEINTTTKTLTCDCDDDDVQLAITEYGATFSKPPAIK